MDITVSSGFINSLIFYSNIVKVNEHIFLPHRTTNPITLFISWFNLDLGIETCFYDGLDAYMPRLGCSLCFHSTSGVLLDSSSSRPDTVLGLLDLLEITLSLYWQHFSCCPMLNCCVMSSPSSPTLQWTQHKVRK